MFKLMIVDDEKQVRETLQQHVAWESLGIGRVETARNGMAALERLADYRPDIVLCDIRMPKMDGMIFANHLRRILPDSRLIFISGYADKESLKAAIRLQAVNFIEKPIDMGELESAVRQAVTELRQMEAGKAQLRRQTAVVAESIPVILEHAALELIRAEADAARERKRLERVGCRLLDAGFFTVAAITMEWDGLMTPDEQTAIRQAILQRLNQPGNLHPENPAPNGRDYRRMAGFCSDGLLLVILAGFDMGREKTDVSDLLSELEGIRPGRLSAMAGIGPLAERPDQLPGSFRLAVEAMRQLFYRKSDKLLMSGDLMPETPFLPDPELAGTFRELLARGDTAGIGHLMSDLVSKAISCHDGNINHVKNVFFNLVVVTLDFTRKGNADPFVRQADQPYIWSRFGKMSNIHELSDFVTDHVRFHLRQEDVVDQKLQRIYACVQSNYHRADLTLQDVADAVHLSQSYLCSFFKKATGKTLIEYTTEVRIEMAMKLLQDERIRLYTVAERTGFGDANYFSTLFKKVTGITPTEHRERLRG